jgi:hypothetical protein
MTTPSVIQRAMQLEKSAQRRALHNRYNPIRAFDHALNVVTANSSLKWPGCDEFFTCTHHVFPLLVRVPFLVEKCGSLLLANGASMFIGQSQQMRKCDFGHHSISILPLLHGFCPHCPKIGKKMLTLLWLLQ